MKSSLVLSVSLLFFPHVAIASLPVYVGDARVMLVDGALSVCTPTDAEQDMPVEWFGVTSMNAEASLHWAIARLPSTEPIMMQPGACMQLMKEIPGYRTEGGWTTNVMKPGDILGASVGAVREENESHWIYAAEFCKSEENVDGAEYIYFEIEEDGEGRSRCEAIQRLQSVN